MGEEQRLSAEEQLRTARQAFEDGTDFTVAVEEEFALLDGELELVNRFEDLQAAGRGTELEPHLVGELIASEAEARTGKCRDFTEVAAVVRERRAQLQALAGEQGMLLGSTGTHPWARWQDQRIIDTPHYRRNNELLRYVVWRNNTFGLHVHVGIRGGDRAIAVNNALRNFLPELLALSASSPFVEEVDSGLHSARTQIFTRMFPRCGIPDAYDGWAGFEDYVAFLYRTGSITEHTQLWWSVRPHLAYPTIEIRIMDAQPEVSDSIGVAAFAYALAARCARAHDEGEPLPNQPNRLLEENFWRAIRYGLEGELLDFDRGEAVPARARLEELLEWVGPVAGEIGAAPFLGVPDQNAAERQRSRFQEGAGLREIYAEQVRAGHVETEERLAEDERELAGTDEPTIDDLMEAMRQIEVGQFLLSTVSTMASLAYGKLESGNTGQAKIAIDAIQALLPVLEGEVEEAMLAISSRHLANLKVAYADAVGSAE